MSMHAETYTENARSIHTPACNTLRLTLEGCSSVSKHMNASAYPSQIFADIRSRRHLPDYTNAMSCIDCTPATSCSVCLRLREAAHVYVDLALRYFTIL